MLYEAVNWHDDGAEERPPLDAVLAVPENARYVADWGRTGDVALYALDRRDEPVGAVVVPAVHRGRSPATATSPTTSPSSSIGVYPEFRGQQGRHPVAGLDHRPGRARPRAGDQPEREPRESGQAPLRAPRLRGRRRARRHPHDAPRAASPNPRRWQRTSGGDRDVARRMQRCRDEPEGCTCDDPGPRARTGSRRRTRNGAVHPAEPPRAQARAVGVPHPHRCSSRSCASASSSGGRSSARSRRSGSTTRRPRRVAAACTRRRPR